MKKIPFAVLMVIALLAVLVSACGSSPPEPTPTPLPPTPTHTPPKSKPTSPPPTPTPEVHEPNYTNAAMGLSIWYPDDWAFEEFVEQVVFASSEEIIRGTELETGAVMMLTGSELEGPLTLEDLVETTLSEFAFEEVETSDPEPCTIGGQPGIMITFEGTPEGGDVHMRGFLGGAERDGWGYLFIGASILDEWSEYGPVLETMLDSVCFEGTEPIYTNATLGLSLRYPEDWIYEEDGEYVIFGTSEEIISGAELETGAAMLVMGSALEGLPTVEEMVEMMLSESPFEDMQISEANPRTIGGRQGIMVTFEGTPDGLVSIRGFLVGAQHEGWDYLFLGFSVLDEWCEYGPVLETTLDSVEFTK